MQDETTDAASLGPRHPLCFVVFAARSQRGRSERYPRSAAFTTFARSMARVIGPTPPGFGER